MAASPELRRVYLIPGRIYLSQRKRYSVLVPRLDLFMRTIASRLMFGPHLPAVLPWRLGTFAFRFRNQRVHRYRIGAPERINGEDDNEIGQSNGCPCSTHSEDDSWNQCNAGKGTILPRKPKFREWCVALTGTCRIGLCRRRA
jgi:hypothetical protein